MSLFRRRNTPRWPLVAGAAAAIALAWTLGPDLVRYIRLKTM